MLDNRPLTTIEKICAVVMIAIVVIGFGSSIYRNFNHPKEPIVIAETHKKLCTKLPFEWRVEHNTIVNKYRVCHKTCSNSTYDTKEEAIGAACEIQKMNILNGYSQDGWVK